MKGSHLALCSAGKITD